MDTYEKKYKEANDKVAARFGSNIAKEIFTDLYESEDEKVRKEIMDFIDTKTIDSDERRNRWFSWLEKQGTSYTKRDVDNAFVEGMAFAKDELEKQGEQKFIDDLTQQEVMDIAVAKCFEQGEQKPTDKVEPKFQNGQWIVWQNKCYKVNYNGCGYELIDQNGLSTSLEYGTVDKSAHLWTIQEDAKDGDVLYLQKDGKEHIIIYKGVIKERFRTFVSAYCAYNGIVDAFCFADVSRYIDIAYGGIMPATKEQRDLLFQKMKEAGYEWDSEKKELKKIEKESAEWSDTEKQEMFIKSQRPHFWKPTDEQMKALKYVAYHLMPDSNYRKEMFSLYEDLKKLK